MVKVIAWPPVGLTAWEITKHYPVSSTQDFFGRPSYTSSFGRPRYLASATVPGIGKDRYGGGWMEMLKGEMRGGARLVRVPSISPLWHLSRRGQNLALDMLEWTSGGETLKWTSGGEDLAWSSSTIVTGEPDVYGGRPALRVTGLPSRVKIGPSEFVTVSNSDTEQTARALTPAQADDAGVAIIRLDEEILIGGIVSIGVHRNLVFEAMEMPRAVQPVRGDWAYEWSFRQVFEDEVRGGFEDDNPWILPEPVPAAITFGSTSVTFGSTSVTFGAS